MSTLGPGTRVWVGWDRDENIGGGGGDPRCRYGTVDEGPVPPGFPVTGLDGRPYYAAEKAWFVTMDGESYRRMIAERLLFPVDHGNADVRERDRELADA